ncbi:ATP-binding protein [Salinispira pacifica]
MNWSRLYIRFSLSLILYIVYVMLLPLFGRTIPAAALLAILPVTVAASVKLWPGIFLAALNAPVTLILAGRTLALPIGSNILSLLPALSAVLAVGILTGMYVQVRRDRDVIRLELAAALSDRERFRSDLVASVERTVARFRTLATIRDARGAVADIERHIRALPSISELLYAGARPPESVEMHDLLPALVERTLVMLEAETVEFNHDLESWKIGAPAAELLGSAVVEMVTNAVHFGSGVDATVVIDLELSEENDRVRIRFLDHGVGFPEPVLFNQKRGWSGMGIPIVRDTVTRLGGTLRLVNETGACYDLNFPVILT